MAGQMRRFEDLDEFVRAAGQRLGESRWHQITQAQVDLFAQATGDDQWIHVDPVRAAAGPFGGTIVHGYLVLSLVSMWLGEVFEVRGLGLMLNASVDGVRFLRPLPVGARVRLVADLESAAQRARGAVEGVVAATVEQQDRPGQVCVARVGVVLRPARPVRRRPERTHPEGAARAAEPASTAGGPAAGAQPPGATGC